MPSSPYNRNIIITRGSSLVELPREESNLKFTNGIRRSFKGKQADIENLAQTLKAQGYQCVVKEGPLYSLDATIGAILTNDSIDANEIPLGQWEFNTSKTNKDLLESVHPIMLGLDPLHLQTLKDWNVSANTNTVPAFDFYLGKGYVNQWETTTTEDAYFTAQYNQAFSIYRLLANGIKDIEVTTTVLKKTFQPFSGYDFTSATAYEGKVLSMATLISSTGMPAWLQAMIAGYDDGFVASEPNSSIWIDKAYGWLQNTISNSESNESRLNLVIEYRFGLWAEDLYGAPI